MALEAAVFDVDVRHRPTRQIVAASGELDISTGPLLGDALSTALGSDCAHLVVDLSRVEFMDASAAGLLVRSAQRARCGGKGFSLILGVPTSYRVLELCGLLHRFEILPGADIRTV